MRRIALLVLAAGAPALWPAAGAARENPCVQASWRGLRCPDLVMARPSHVRVVRDGARRLLRSTSSLDSVGAGPVELVARRTTADRMRARQRIAVVGGGSLLTGSPAPIVFEPIPGQGGYWKWEGAARLELWSLDPSGRQRRRVRTSPKLAYCLRDLRRTHPRLRRSPPDRVYPACDQDPLAAGVTLGTSVGWSDIYPWRYYEQWIDVTGLRGRFALVHVADPLDEIAESNETNNASRALVSLPSGRVVRRQLGRRSG